MGAKRKVMVVDDEARNLRLMEALLVPEGYEVIQARDGEEALAKVRETSPDVILLDVMMPGLDGLEVVRRLRADEATTLIPLVMVTALNEVEDRVQALKAGADDFLTKPVDKTELKARVQSLVKVKAYNDHMRNYQKELESEVAKRTEQLQQALEELKFASLETIYRLSKAAEYRDEDTGSHILRMSHYAAAVAKEMGLTETAVENILYAAPMHDVGKIGIPDSILLKPGKLDPAEWETMKQHATIGARMLGGSRSAFIKSGEVIALTHHEKWDGTGYPEGLRGTAIPLPGRITAIADVFDALTSRRPYKSPFPLDKSLSIIRDGRGAHFDPDAVDAFFSVQEEILQIKEQFRDDVDPQARQKQLCLS